MAFALQKCYDNVPRSKCQKAKTKIFPMSAKSTKATQVLGKALCVASAFFLQVCSEIYDDGISEDLNYGPTI